MNKAFTHATAAATQFAPKRLSAYTKWQSAVFQTLRSGVTDGDAFYIGNLSRVSHQLQKWRALLPNVEPHYALKCNNDDKVAGLLADAGIGFDCASKAEMAQVLAKGVAPERVIFAHPCKTASHLRYAREVNIAQTTFDNEDELHKVKALHPDASLVLRIRTDDSKAKCPLSNKYGADMNDVPRLLETAKALGLNVTGVSFHVGSGCSDLDSYAAALRNARTVFDIAAGKGMKLSLLDIGGGFPGAGSDTSDEVSATGEPSPTSFVDIAATVRKSLASLFPATSGVRVIAEPGRYFVEGAFVLCTSVISRRVTPASEPREALALESAETSGGVRKYSSAAGPQSREHTRYYINDGVYGSFNCVVYDHAVVRPTPIPASVITLGAEGFAQYLAKASPVHVTAAGPGSSSEDVPCAAGEHPSSVWGQTCDGFDVVLPKVNLPQLAIGDWLCFENMGAYTVAAGSTFNGFPKPEIMYMHDEGTA